MSKFDTLLQRNLRKFHVITEEDQTAMGGDPNASAPVGAAPQTQSDAAPTPQGGATSQTPKYDKPYIDLAKMMYASLRMEFDDLDPQEQQAIVSLSPDDIKSDQQAISILKKIEDALNIRKDLKASDETFGPGVKM